MADMPHPRRRRSAASQEARLVALYDALNPWGPSDDYYLDQIMRAPSVLDIGCGTGTLLCAARDAGHTGELVGVDPAPGMLGIARTKRADVTWLEADARKLELDRTFDLITMTGHALQELLDDPDLTAALSAFHRHLAPAGRLVFETRNPARRHWEGWNAEQTGIVVRSPHGEDFDVSHEFHSAVDPDLIRYVTHFRARRSGEVVAVANTLRFIDPDRLRAHLTAVGFEVDAWHGDWDGSPVGPESLEIIVQAVKPSTAEVN